MPDNGIKALVLAAGLGTRLLPHTQQVPKPLFPVAGRPILDIIISRLISAGISAVGVNTHHLHDQVERYLNSRTYPVPVLYRYEPELLGTGGAIANFADFLGNGRPFVVINSDILTDIPVSDLICRHMNDSCAATLAVTDCPEFNTVRIEPDGTITGFTGDPNPPQRCRTFTGLQVIDPVIYRYLPHSGFAGSIDAFSAMIRDGLKIRAYDAQEHYWNDLGTPERYRQALIDTLGPAVFEKAFDGPGGSRIECIPLAGDGSDRKWLRIRRGEQSLVVADHGIQTDTGISEFDSFVAIGTHLREKGLAVPTIHEHDRFSGLVFLSDLGDTLLQSLILEEPDPAAVGSRYRAVIDRVLALATAGAEGFDPAWAYQEPAYSRQTIIEKEGRYFIRAFLRQWLGMAGLPDDALLSEFGRLADGIAAWGIPGFMHRDMQSRNIMVNPGGYFFVDFQGGRLGPIQYDLASLITDPYVDLPQALRKALLAYAQQQLAEKRPLDQEAFQKGYRCCAIARSLQALGAFGYLAGVKRKAWFTPYMAPALNNLSGLLSYAAEPALPVLAKTVARAKELLGGSAPENSQ